MDTRNVIAAISLSAAVIILYGLFFAPETKKLSQNQDTISKNEIVVEDDESPKIEEKNLNCYRIGFYDHYWWNSKERKYSEECLDCM